MGKIELDEKTKQDLIDCSKRLEAAVDKMRVRKGKNKNEVHALILPDFKEITGKTFSVQTFSKYINFKSKIKDYTQNVNVQVYNVMFGLIDPILEKECNIIWDGQMYRDKFIDNNMFDLFGSLVGEWDAYSWDLYTSTKNKRISKKGFIHKFIIKIHSRDYIWCQTRENILESRSMLLLNTGAIIIELNSTDIGVIRKIYLMIHGLDLKDINSGPVRAAYVDSGKYNIKSGEAMMFKANNETLPHIGSRPVEDFENTKIAQYIDYLKNKQILIGDAQ